MFIAVHSLSRLSKSREGCMRWTQTLRYAYPHLGHVTCGNKQLSKCLSGRAIVFLLCDRSLFHVQRQIWCPYAQTTTGTTTTQIIGATTKLRHCHSHTYSDITACIINFHDHNDAHNNDLADYASSDEVIVNSMITIAPVHACGRQTLPPPPPPNALSRYQLPRC
jgi:hypothetical protein